MRIPLPCQFGDEALCEGKRLPLVGVSWFFWGRGTEYTYFFATDKKWNSVEFYTTFETDQPFSFEIPDSLLMDTNFKDRGYPLKGSGYANGVYYAEGKTYIDFIVSSSYMAHIRVQCEDKGQYAPYGDIIFPPSWDTDEKKESAVLKSIPHGALKNGFSN